MLWKLCLFLTLAHAEAPGFDTHAKIPDAMKAKWSEVSGEVEKGYHTAKQKLDTLAQEDSQGRMGRAVRSARQSSFVQSLGGAAHRLWLLTKQKGRHLLVKLDHQLHEKVLDSPDGTAERP